MTYTQRIAFSISVPLRNITERGTPLRLSFLSLLYTFLVPIEIFLRSNRLFYLLENDEKSLMFANSEESEK